MPPSDPALGCWHMLCGAYQRLSSSACCAGVGASLLRLASYEQPFPAPFLRRVLARRYSPARHTIMEAHPDALAHMRNKGWGVSAEGQLPSAPAAGPEPTATHGSVDVVAGRWQDTYRQLSETGVRYDAIFFDT